MQISPWLLWKGQSTILALFRRRILGNIQRPLVLPAPLFYCWLLNWKAFSEEILKNERKLHTKLSGREALFASNPGAFSLLQVRGFRTAQKIHIFRDKKAWQWQCSSESSCERFRTIWGHRTWKCGVSRQKGPESSPELRPEHYHTFFITMFFSSLIYIYIYIYIYMHAVGSITWPYFGHFRVNNLAMVGSITWPSFFEPIKIGVWGDLFGGGAKLVFLKKNWSKKGFRKKNVHLFLGSLGLVHCCCMMSLDALEGCAKKTL